MRLAKLVLVVVAWCSAMMLALYQPFMKIWTGNDSSLMRHALTPILMVAYFYVRESRQLLLIFKSAASLWKEDRMKPIVSGIANLALNITLVLTLPDKWKLDGVIFSTIVTFALIQLPWENHIVFTRFFTPKEGRKYYIENLRFVIITCAICFVTWLAASCIKLEGFGGLALKGFVAVLVCSSLAFIFFRKDINFRKVIKKS